MEFFVFEPTAEPVETTEIKFNHFECSACGIRPTGRVGEVEIQFNRVNQIMDIAWNADGIYATSGLFMFLKRSQVTGWRQGYLRIQKNFKFDSKNKEYHELIIVGRATLSTKNLELGLIIECRHCGFKKYKYPDAGFVIPIDCWDKTDIFSIAEFPGIIVISDRLRLELSKHTFSGFELINTKEWRPPI